MARISVTTSTPVDSNTWRYNVEVIESDGSGSKTNHEDLSKNRLSFYLKERTRIQYCSDLTLPR
jgi:hypothetical protein